MCGKPLMYDFLREVGFYLTCHEKKNQNFLGIQFFFVLFCFYFYFYFFLNDKKMYVFNTTPIGIGITVLSLISGFLVGYHPLNKFWWVVFKIIMADISENYILNISHFLTLIYGIITFNELEILKIIQTCIVHKKELQEKIIKKINTMIIDLEKKNENVNENEKENESEKID